MDGAGIYLAPLLNLPPRGAYSDAKRVVQQLNLLNARGANMVIYGKCGVWCLSVTLIFCQATQQASLLFSSKGQICIFSIRSLHVCRNGSMVIVSLYV